MALKKTPNVFRTATRCLRYLLVENTIYFKGLKNVSLLWIFVGVMLLTSSCSDPFAEAQKANTVDAYQRFVQENPKSPRIEEAKMRIRRLALASAEHSNTVVAWMEFINRFEQDGTTVELQHARKGLEYLEFNQATNAQTETACNLFIEKYPRSTKVNDAKNQIRSLAYAAASRTNNIETWNVFLQRFGVTNNLAEVHQGIAALVQLAFSEAAVSNSVESYRKFISTYSSDPFSDSATTQVSQAHEALDWINAVQTNNFEVFQNFIARYPKSSRCDLASKCMSWAQWQSSKPLEHEYVVTGVVKNGSLLYVTELGANYTQRTVQGDLKVEWRIKSVERNWSQFSDYGVDIKSRGLNVLSGSLVKVTKELSGVKLHVCKGAFERNGMRLYVPEEGIGFDTDYTGAIWADVLLRNSEPFTLDGKVTLVSTNATSQSLNLSGIIWASDRNVWNSYFYSHDTSMGASEASHFRGMKSEPAVAEGKPFVAFRIRSDGFLSYQP